MSPTGPDRAILARRLRLLKETLDQLAMLRPADAELDLQTDVMRRAAAERFIQVIVDVSVDIASHLAVALLGHAPETSRASFDLLTQAGVIDEQLATRLKPAVGLRNVLVHRYVDIDVTLVADAIEEVGAAFEAYVVAVAQWLTPPTDA